MRHEACGMWHEPNTQDEPSTPHEHARRGPCVATYCRVRPSQACGAKPRKTKRKGALGQSPDHRKSQLVRQQQQEVARFEKEEEEEAPHLDEASRQGGQIVRMLSSASVGRVGAQSVRPVVSGAKAVAVTADSAAHAIVAKAAARLSHSRSDRAAAPTQAATPPATRVVELVRTPLGLGLSVDGRNRVVVVASSSQAERSGVAVQDRLLSLNGQPLGGGGSFRQQLGAIKVGATVRLEIEIEIEIEIENAVEGGVAARAASPAAEQAGRSLEANEPHAHARPSLKTTVRTVQTAVHLERIRSLKRQGLLQGRHASTPQGLPSRIGPVASSLLPHSARPRVALRRADNADRRAPRNVASSLAGDAMAVGLSRTSVRRLPQDEPPSGSGCEDAMEDEYDEYGGHEEDARV